MHVYDVNSFIHTQIDYIMMLRSASYLQSEMWLGASSTIISVFYLYTPIDRAPASCGSVCQNRVLCGMQQYKHKEDLM